MAYSSTGSIQWAPWYWPHWRDHLVLWCWTRTWYWSTSLVLLHHSHWWCSVAGSWWECSAHRYQQGCSWRWTIYQWCWTYCHFSASWSHTLQSWWRTLLCEDCHQWEEMCHLQWVLTILLSMSNTNRHPPQLPAPHWVPSLVEWSHTMHRPTWPPTPVTLLVMHQPSPWPVDQFCR